MKIGDLINQYGLPLEEKWQNEEEMKYDRYIEVQIWDDSIIKDYKLNNLLEN